MRQDKILFELIPLTGLARSLSHSFPEVIGRTDAEAESLILWLPDAKCQLIGKNPDVGKG